MTLQCMFHISGAKQSPLQNKDWYALGPQGSTWTWPDGHLPTPHPFKAVVSPLRNIAPVGDSVMAIKIDVAHTYAIAGYGKDELASSIVFLACHCGLFGRGTYEQQLEEAYHAFRGWCTRNSKYTSIRDFSYGELKITSPLKRTFFLRGLWVSPLRNLSNLPRLQDFPRGLGKGHDAGLLSRWLTEFVEQPHRASVPATGQPLYAWVSLDLCAYVAYLGLKPEEKHRDMYDVVRWGVRASNGFFATLYRGNLWLTRQEAARAVQLGQDMLDTSLHAREQTRTWCVGKS